MGKRSMISRAPFDESDIIPGFSLWESAFIIAFYAAEISMTIAFGWPWMSLVISLVCILEEVLAAKKSLVTVIFGISSYALYLTNIISHSLWGEVPMTILVYIPMVILQYSQWKRHMAGESFPSSFGGPYIFVKSLIFAIAFGIGYSIILRIIGDPFPLLDGLSTGFTVAMAILSIKRLNDTWIFWMIAIILDIALWIMAGDMSMMIYFIVAAINTIYGLSFWSN